MQAKKRMVLIHAFLAFHLLVPLHYYTCNNDPQDERFAWRMFSSTRMNQCSGTIHVDGSPIPNARLSQYFPVAVYRNMISRGRQGALEEMSERLCHLREDNPQSIQWELQCRSPFSGATTDMKEGRVACP